MASNPVRRQRVEGARAQRDNYLRALIENTLDLIAVLDRDGVMRYVSPSHERVLGYTADELIGRSAFDFVHPDDQARVVDVFRIHVATPGATTVLEFRLYRKDGSWLSLEGIGKNLLNDPVVAGVVVSTRDISERTAAQEAERTSRRQLLEAQEIGHLGSWELDLRSNVTTWSDELYRLAGLDPCAGAISDAQAWNILHPDDRARVRRLVSEATRRGTSFEYECRGRRPDRTICWFHVRGKVLVDGTGRPLRILGTVQDITERKQAAQEIERSHRALYALSARLEAAREEEARRIARDIHDDLGQALTALKLDLSWLAKRLTRDGGRAQPVSVKLKGMTQVVDDSIESVRRIATRLRPRILDAFGLGAACAWQVQEFTQRTGISCARTIAAVTLDDQRAAALFRILQEALTNVARHAHATHVRVSLGRRGRDVFLRIEDNGCSVTAAQLRDDAAVGLQGMRERARLFGGTLSVRGVRGRGTTVTARIPAAASGGK